MADKASGIMRTAGLLLCLLCAAYMLYYVICRQASAGLEASGERARVVIGIAALTEGEVARVGDGCTVIRYYHEWDGTEYQSIRHRVSADYPESAKLPVIYTVGMGAGSCLAVGFCRKTMQVLGMTGAVLLLLGIALNFRKKGTGKWQEEKL